MAQERRLSSSEGKPRRVGKKVIDIASCVSFFYPTGPPLNRVSLSTGFIICHHCTFATQILFARTVLTDTHDTGMDGYS